MKTVKYGKQEYQRMENLFDIGDERFMVFKQYLLQTFEGIDTPIWAGCWGKVKRHLNDQNYADLFIELVNFDKAIALKGADYDAYSMCFALLHLQKGETQGDFSSEYQKAKLEKLRKAGLTRGEVEEVVVNFLKASPKAFRAFLEVLSRLAPTAEN